MITIIQGKENPTDQKPQKETGNRKLKGLVQFQEKERRGPARAPTGNATINTHCRGHGRAPPSRLFGSSSHFKFLMTQNLTKGRIFLMTIFHIAHNFPSALGWKSEAIKNSCDKTIDRTSAHQSPRSSFFFALEFMYF